MVEPKKRLSIALKFFCIEFMAKLRTASNVQKIWSTSPTLGEKPVMCVWLNINSNSQMLCALYFLASCSEQFYSVCLFGFKENPKHFLVSKMSF